MACCKGEKIPYEELFPEELKNLRKQLTGYVGDNLGQGATPYTGEIAAPVNPASNAALNMVMGMMGHGGYSPPAGFTYQGGQQGSPIGPATNPPPPGVPPPGDLPGTKLPPGWDPYDPYKNTPPPPGVPPPADLPGTKLPPGYDPYDPNYTYLENPQPWWDVYNGKPPWQV